MRVTRRLTIRAILIIGESRVNDRCTAWLIFALPDSLKDWKVLMAIIPLAGAARP
jgi:hypothetical protein